MHGMKQIDGEFIGDGIGDSGPRVTRIETAHALLPGEYWRVSKDVLSEGEIIAAAGDVLLIADVRQDNGEDHRVDVWKHPRCGAKRGKIYLLVNDFLEHFQPAPDAASVRAREIAALQGRAADVQADIQRAQSDPAYLNTQVQKAIAQASSPEERSGLPAELGPKAAYDVFAMEQPSLVQITRDLTPAVVAAALDAVKSASSVVAAQGAWFSGRIAEVSALTQEVIPYFQEGAMVPIARSKRVMEQAKKMEQSIQTLGLFIGDGVHVDQIREGEPGSGRVHLYQRRLFIDEEMAYFSDYAANEVSASDPKAFFDAIARDSRLLDLMVPASRGVVLVAFSRSHHWHNADTHPLIAAMLAKKDRAAYLLLRDGDAAYLVHNDVGSHQEMKRLFPELDLDGSVFTGMDGSRVTPESLVWVDRVERLQAEAVHYRRIAVMLAGLISREVIWKGVPFGDLFLAKAQDGLFELIRDDSGEGMLGNNAGSLTDYINDLKRTARKGSTVLIDSRSFGDSTVAPNFFSSGREPSCRVSLDSVARSYTVDRSGTALTISATMPHAWGRREVTSKVELHSGGRWASWPWLCIDRLDPDKLDALLSRRANRQGYSDRFTLLHEARRLAAEQRAEEAPLVSALVTALRDSELEADEQAATEAIREAIAARRCAGGGVPALESPEATVLMEQVYRLLRNGEVPLDAIEQAAGREGAEPLRVTVDSKGKTLLYAAPRQPDNRGAKQIEVERWVVKSGARGVTLASPVVQPMLKEAPSETMRHEWSAADNWVVVGAPAHRKSVRLQWIDLIERRSEHFRQMMMGPWTDELYEEVMREQYLHASAWVDKHHRMPSQHLYVPVGLVSNKRGKLLVVTVADWLERVIARNAPDLEAAVVRSRANWRRCSARDGFIDRFEHDMRTVGDKPLRGATITFIDGSASPAKFSAIDTRNDLKWLSTLSTQSAELAEMSKALSVSALEAVREQQNRTGGFVPNQWWFAPGVEADSNDPIMRWLSVGAGDQSGAHR